MKAKHKEILCYMNTDIYMKTEDISVDIEKDLMFDTSNYELENHYLKQ